MMLSHEQWVPLERLASELGVHRTQARRVALKIGKPMGIFPVRRQMRALGHRQRTLCWTREQADRIVAVRVEQGFEL